MYTIFIHVTSTEYDNAHMIFLSSRKAFSTLAWHLAKSTADHPTEAAARYC